MKHPIITEEAQNVVRQVLESGDLSLFRGTPEGQSGGPKVQELEAMFRDYFDVRHAVAMNSATSALHAACIACDIGQGDEVIVTPYSFVSSATCVYMARARPVFVDIEPHTFCIDPDKIEEKITYRTKAIIPVHLHGHPANMTEIMRIAREHGLWVIEDTAQAIGATYNHKYAGTIGDCGVFSFNQSKHISTGEGGMLITNDDKIARIARAIRNHGEVSDPHLGMFGYNYRMCEVEAALAIEQFKVLDKMTDIRIALCRYMNDALKEMECFTPPVTYPWCKHVFYTYAVKFKGDRNSFQQKMMELGVYFGSGYVKPLHLLPIFGGKEGQCPVAERMWGRELMVFDWLRYPVTIQDVDTALKTIKEVV